MIMDKALECIALIQWTMIQAEGYFDCKDYKRGELTSNYAADAAEQACALADGMSDCLRNAKNAHPEMFKFWENIADHAARLVNAAETLRGDCIIQQDLAGS
jgi:hypothetical protein